MLDTEELKETERVNPGRNQRILRVNLDGLSFARELFYRSGKPLSKETPAISGIMLPSHNIQMNQGVMI